MWRNEATSITGEKVVKSKAHAVRRLEWEMKQRHVVGGGEGDAAEVRVDRMRKARKVVDVLDQVAVVHRVLFFSATRERDRR